MSEEQLQAEATAAAEETAAEELKDQESVENPPKENEEEKRQASERTEKRRRQRAKAALRREQEARIKAEKDAEYYRGLAEARAQLQQTNENGEPQHDDFDTDWEYQRAYTDWAIKQSHKPEVIQKETSTETGETPEMADFRTRGVEKHGNDFNDMLEAALNNEFATSQIMAETMMSDENGLDLAMHFYDNPEEADRIARLSPLQQVRELATLTEKLSAPPQQTTTAPEPVVNDKTTSAPVTDLGKIKAGVGGTDEYIRRRQEQKRARSKK